MKRRGFVILSVFIIVMLALLVVTGVLYMAQAESTARNRAASRAQTRSLSWSAAQVLMNELNAQRTTILDGGLPELEEQYELYDADGALALVRILPIGADGTLLQPESARLDINEIDAETLAATNVVDTQLAQKIIEHRDQHFDGTYRSLADLSSVPGIDPQLVFGPASRFNLMQRAQRSRSEQPMRTPSGADASAVEALSDVITVFGFEPAIQRNEKQRINLDVPWSDELGERINERFGDGASQILKQLFERVDFNEESKIIETMIAFGTETEDWAEILDVLTTEAGAFHFGRVNINTASRDVLAALPGIEPEQAAQIVQMRESLDADDRASIIWPIVQGILPREAYVELAGGITTRSWTYRLYMAAGLVDREQPDGPLGDPQIYELVIDLSAPQPRIAYLRDVTMLQSAVMLASDATVRGIGVQSEVDDELDDTPSANSSPDQSSNVTESGLDPSPLNPAPLMPTPPKSTQPAETNAAEPPPARRRLGRWHTAD